MSEQALLGVGGITKFYRRGREQVHALEDVSFELGSGVLAVLVGPSGSGKTTLLNVLCGWEEADAGSIAWRGRALASGARLPWGEMALLPQSLGLIEELSVRENIELAGHLARDAVAVRRADELVRAFGLGDLQDRRPEEISLGEQQRTALARALLRMPKLLLADEPTAHQDSMWARGMLRLLTRACAVGMTCLVATHNEEVLGFAHRLLHIRDGRVSVEHRLGQVGGVG